MVNFDSFSDHIDNPAKVSPDARTGAGTAPGANVVEDILQKMGSQLGSPLAGSPLFGSFLHPQSDAQQGRFRRASQASVSFDAPPLAPRGHVTGAATDFSHEGAHDTFRRVPSNRGDNMMQVLEQAMSGLSAPLDHKNSKSEQAHDRSSEGPESPLGRGPIVRASISRAHRGKEGDKRENGLSPIAGQRTGAGIAGKKSCLKRERGGGKLMFSFEQGSSPLKVSWRVEVEEHTLACMHACKPAHTHVHDTNTYIRTTRRYSKVYVYTHQFAFR